MTKFLIVLAVIAVAIAWIALGRRGRSEQADAAPRRHWRRPNGPPADPAPMVACAHCGVHLPQPEAVLDAAGRPFCSEAHRLAGPRG